MSGFLIECRNCPATLLVDDGTPFQVASRVRSAGWTTPWPFADLCPACSKEAT